MWVLEIEPGSSARVARALNYWAINPAPRSASVSLSPSLSFFFKLCSVLPASQKRAPYPITDGREPLYGCWELNSGPLDEQPMPAPLPIFFFFLKQNLCVTLAILELTWYTRLALNSQRLACLYFPSTRFKGMYHQCHLTLRFLFLSPGSNQESQTSFVAMTWYRFFFSSSSFLNEGNM